MGIDSRTPSSDCSISGDCGAGLCGGGAVLCGGGWKTCGCKSWWSGSWCAVGGVRTKLPGSPSTGDSSKSVTADAGCSSGGTVRLDVWRLRRCCSGEGDECSSRDMRWPCVCARVSWDCSISATPGSPASCSWGGSKLLASGKYSCSPWGPVPVEWEAGEGCSGWRSLELRRRGDVGCGGALTTADTLGPLLAPKGDFPRSRYPR